MNETARQWLDGALMDLRSIEKIMDDAFLTPIACFHSQQCVEKSLKAVLENCGFNIPRIVGRDSHPDNGGLILLSFF